MMRRIFAAAFLACLAGPACVLAQETELAAIGEKYSGENAVMTRDDERLVISYEDGKLVARSHIEREMLLLSDRSPALHNTATIYHGFFSKVSDIEAASFIPDRKGYKKVKATSFKTTRSEDANVFYDDAQQTTVTFPSLVKGARTFISYTITHKDLHFLPSFSFQSYVPVHTATFSVTAPKWVHLKPVLKGLETSRVKSSEQSSKNEITYTWTATEMPRVKGYENAPNVFYYLTHLLVRITDYKTPDASASQQVLSTTDDLYHFYYPFIRDINKAEDENITSIVATLTKDVTDQREKARRIYAWVQQNIRYVAYENGMGGFVPREASLVCSRKFGDCKDMSSLLVAMCRKAGLNAYFTWIGTRDKPYRYEDTPVPAVDNHMICTIKIGEEYIFVDGTDFTLPFGVAPSALQGKEALVGLGETSYKVITVPELEASKTTSKDSTHIALTEAGLNGSIDVHYVGYVAWRLGAQLMFHNETEKEDMGRDLTSRGSNKYKMTSFTSSISEDGARDVRLHADFDLPDYAKKLDKEWYVNMNLNRTILNTDDLKDRKVPIEYDYMFKGDEIVVLDIPKGYHVSYLPPDAEQTIPKLWSYKVSYKKTAKQVRLEKKFTIDTLYNHPEQFAAHAKLVEGLRNAFKESVVLAAD